MNRRLRTRRSRLAPVLILLFGSAGAIGAQESGETGDSGTSREPVAIPREYRTIGLGMTPDDVKELLSQDPWFDYRGEPDISLLERPRASLIDAGGSLFITRGLFQFEGDALSAIMLELNPEMIDWFTVYTTLEERYGPPVDMDPTKAWWEDGSTRLALERPLTVKYLDLGVFDAAIAEERDRKAWRERSREEFLDEF